MPTPCHDKRFRTTRIDGRSAVGMFVSGNFFNVLGVTAARGRTLTEADNDAGGRTVVVLSHEGWEQLFAAMVIVFGTLALLITAAGLYGVIGFIVSQRTREIGIRMALGARNRDVAHLVAGYAIAPLLGGLFLGMADAFWVGRLLPALIAGGRGGDPAIFVMGGVLVVLTTGLAVMAPVRAATAVDPTTVLRNE